MGANKLLLAGLTALTVFHIRKWRDDRQLALRTRALWQQPGPEFPETPLVSILVAAWNEADMIERHICSVVALRYPNLEYVICAGGQDGTFEHARSLAGPGIIVLEQQLGEGKQGALRRCFEASSGAICFCTDADCLLTDDAFERTLAPVLLGQADAGAGSIRPLPEQLKRGLLATSTWGIDVYFASRRPDEMLRLNGANSAIRREVLEAARALRWDTPTAEDYQLSMFMLAKGMKIRKAADSQVQTRYHDDLLAFIRQQTRWHRDVLLHGAKSDQKTDLKWALVDSAMGASMFLLLALLPVLGKEPLKLWLLTLYYRVLRRMRFVAFGSLCDGGFPPGLTAKALAYSVVLSFVDFTIWTAALVEALVPRWRHRW